MGDPVEFRVLGPLEVIADGEPVRVGGPRPRALLGVLLVHAGRAVSTERLIDQMWGDDPPPTAGAALQVHVSALRKVLGDRLVTEPSGYLLEAAEDEVDALRFEALVVAGRRHLAERPATAAADLGVALSLWRGEPYGGVPAGSDVAAARLRLTELHLSAVDDRLDAELTLGRHAAVIDELADLVAEHPTRERRVGLRMLALYRSGRIDEARAGYRALRDAFDTEPGAEITAFALSGLAISRGGSVLDQLTLVSRVAAVELDEGRPEAALRPLAVTARERERLGSPPLMPDELGEERSAWAAASAALGAFAEEIIDWAADLPFRAVVDELLADHKLTGDG